MTFNVINVMGGGHRVSVAVEDRPSEHFDANTTTALSPKSSLGLDAAEDLPCAGSIPIGGGEVIGNGCDVFGDAPAEELHPSEEEESFTSAAPESPNAPSDTGAAADAAGDAVAAGSKAGKEGSAAAAEGDDAGAGERDTPSDAAEAPPPDKPVWSIASGSSADHVLPQHRPAMPSLEAMRASPHYPVYVTPDPSIPGVEYCGSSDLAQHIDINGAPFDVDSSTFVGKLQVQIRGLETTNYSVFSGKRRYLHVAAQGRFKRPVRLSALCTGQEFSIPFYGLGKSMEYFMDRVFHACASIFSRTSFVDAHGDRPHFLNPLCASAQVFNISLPGEEPSIWCAQEDCRLLHPGLADASGAPLSPDARRKWCDKEENVEGLCYETNKIYTIHIWQHMMDFSSYKLNVGTLMSFDLVPFMSSQPLQLMVKDVDSCEYAYSMLVWHQRLLYPGEDKSEEDRRRAARRIRANGGGSLLQRLWHGI